jgi:hypothetical protein
MRQYVKVGEMHRLSENERRHSRVLAIIFVILVGLIFVPAGAYRVQGAKVQVNSLASPFSDYGVYLATTAAIFALLVIAPRRYSNRRRFTPLGYVVQSGAVLGLMVPDLIASRNRTFMTGASGHLVQVDLSLGFWLTFATAILLFSVACITFFLEKFEGTDDLSDPRSDAQALGRA